jgi:hypothetical protein
MMPTSLRDSPNDARCLCWFSADSVDARVARSDCSVITTKRLEISSCKTPAARSRSQSRPRYEAKWVSPLPRFIARAPEPAAKSP